MAYSKLDNSRLNYKKMEAEPDLISAAVNFIHEHCTDLRFDAEITAKETPDMLFGTSISANQIPYSMQMDIDRLCLENAVKNFLNTGCSKDAFDVYFCYIEMFIGKYAACRRMIEMLSEFESNGSSLLMKHRDHYSHSVYVFALGLAVFETNTAFREIYMRFYNISDDHEAAHHFLKFWGLTSLFHDIGYPFELPFEQVESYFDISGKKRKNCPYIMYSRLDSLTEINEKAGKQLEELYNKAFENTNELFAFDIVEKLGQTYRLDKTGMEVILKNKPTDPDCFGYFMDHAYFSAAVLFKELSSVENDGEPYKFEKATVDALTAILMHNSLYKFSIAFYKNDLNIPFKAELHPLAYLLMLCDELQCWNRTSYGRNSRTELHPMDCKFRFSDGKIEANYIYDKNEERKIKEYEKDHSEGKKDEDGKPVKLKSYSEMYVSDEEQKAGKKSSFLSDIEKIIDVQLVSLNVSYSLEEANYKHKNEYLSRCNFIHLYNFAAALNSRYNCYSQDEKRPIPSKEKQEEDFDAMSLEYKLYNISQAKMFDKYLDHIGCFYTDRDVDFEMVTEFTDEDMQKIGPMEHGRWVREHWAMGWGAGDPMDGEKIPEDKNEKEKMSKLMREQKRIHPLMMERPENGSEDDAIKTHYNELSEDEQDKDTAPMNYMLKLIKEFEGLRIYKLK